MNAWKWVLAAWCVASCLFAWWLKRVDDRAAFVASLEALARSARLVSETFEEMIAALGDVSGSMARLTHVYLRADEWPRRYFEETEQ